MGRSLSRLLRCQHISGMIPARSAAVGFFGGAASGTSGGGEKLASSLLCTSAWMNSARPPKPSSSLDPSRCHIIALHANLELTVEGVGFLHRHHLLFGFLFALGRVQRYIETLGIKGGPDPLLWSSWVIQWVVDLGSC